MCLRAPVSGSLPPGSKFVSIVCQARMVSTGDNKIILPSRSNTLHPVSSCRVPELGVCQMVRSGQPTGVLIPMV
jgi:hypothetical protein